MNLPAAIDPAFTKLASAAHIYQETTEAFASSAEKLAGRQKELAAFLKQGITDDSGRFEDLYADVVQLQTRNEHVGQARAALDDAFDAALELGKQPGGIAGESFDGAMQAIRHSGIPNMELVRVPVRAGIGLQTAGATLYGVAGGSLGLSPALVASTFEVSTPTLQALSFAGLGIGAVATSVTALRQVRRAQTSADTFVNALGRHADASSRGAGMPKDSLLAGDTRVAPRGLAKGVESLAAKARAHADEVAGTTSTITTRVENALSSSIDAQSANDLALASTQARKDRLLALAQDVRTRTEAEALDRADALGGAYEALPPVNVATTATHIVADDTPLAIDMAKAPTVRIAMPGETVQQPERIIR